MPNQSAGLRVIPHLRPAEFDGLRLTPRDVALLVWLSRVRYAEARQIALRFDWGRSALSRRLLKLREHGLIDRLSFARDWFNSGAFYAPTPRGMRRVGYPGERVSLSAGRAGKNLAVINVAIAYELAGYTVLTPRELLWARFGMPQGYEPVMPTSRQLWTVRRSSGVSREHLPSLVLLPKNDAAGKTPVTFVEVDSTPKRSEDWRQLFDSYRASRRHVRSIVYWTASRRVAAAVERWAAKDGFSFGPGRQVSVIEYVGPSAAYSLELVHGAVADVGDSVATQSPLQQVWLGHQPAIPNQPAANSRNRDEELLAWIGRHGWVMASQIISRWGWTPASLSARARRLEQARLIERAPLKRTRPLRNGQRQPYAWMLTKAGARAAGLPASSTLSRLPSLGNEADDHLAVVDIASRHEKSGKWRVVTRREIEWAARDRYELPGAVSRVQSKTPDGSVHSPDFVLVSAAHPSEGPATFVHVEPTKRSEAELQEILRSFAPGLRSGDIAQVWFLTGDYFVRVHIAFCASAVGLRCDPDGDIDGGEDIVIINDAALAPPQPVA